MSEVPSVASGGGRAWSVRLACLLAVVAAVAGLGNPAAAETRRFAVVVGVADYQNFEGLWWADADASAFRDALMVDPRWSVTGNVQVLLNSQATKAGLQAALAAVAATADSDDVVVFFYSGHGDSYDDVSPYDELDGSDEYLCPYDSLTTSYAKDIRDDELSDWLGAIHAGTTVVILDTCYSGGMGDNVHLAALMGGPRVKTLNREGRQVVPGDGMADDLLRGAAPVGEVVAMGDPPTNTIVLTACADDELSYEFDQLEHGLFTFIVLEGLDSVAADQDRSGDVSAEELFGYVDPRVNGTWFEADEQAYQSPQMIDGKSGQANFVAPPWTPPTPTRISLVNMDANPNWTMETAWIYGQPLGMGGSYGWADPTSGHTGSRVYAYNLTGDYANNLTAKNLTSKVFNCSAYDYVVVRYYRWLGVEDNSCDHARFQVSNNGSTWVNVWSNGVLGISDFGWVREEFNISSLAGRKGTVYLRWVMGPTDSSFTFCGWNIDDVELLGGVIPTMPTLTITAGLDSGWVYQNTAVSTLDRHKSVLTVNITGGSAVGQSYAITVQENGGAMTHFQVAQPAAMVAGSPRTVNVVGGRRNTAAASPFVDGAYVPYTLNVNVTGSPFSQTATVVVPLVLRPLADLDGDGAVTAADKLEINKNLNGLATLPGIALRELDLTGDGATVNAEDKLVINQILNGLMVP